MLRNAWLLAVGTLTAIPTAAPRAVDRRIAGLAMILAPLAVLPLGLAVGVIALIGMPAMIKGILAVGVLAVGTRAFHLDGLADTVDGLAASHDRERSLAVMKTGDVGPAGAVALILVIGVQAVGFAYVLNGWRGGVLAMVAVIGRVMLPPALTSLKLGGAMASDAARRKISFDEMSNLTLSDGRARV